MAVVALLRHFICPCCWELASVLSDTKELFDSAGAKQIAVGVGSPDKARILAEHLPFPLDCLYADPGRKAYDLFGLYFGIGRTFFNPASVKVFSRFDSLKDGSIASTLPPWPHSMPRSNPEWNESFVFIVSDRATELLIKLLDSDTGTKVDFVAEATIPLEVVYMEGSIPPTTYNVVKGEQYCGEIKVGLTFTSETHLWGVEDVSYEQSQRLL